MHFLYKLIKNEVRIFFTALMFYTRIPCPAWVDHSAEYINKATRYFPLIGWIVGSISATVFCMANFLWNTEIATFISIIAGVLATGAFHEDGFADVCDGFGGGWTKQKILDIMKDSRIGAFGGIGLVCLLLLKYLALSSLMAYSNEGVYFVFAVFIVYHSLARLTAVSIVFYNEYAREDADSKAKPIAQDYSWREVIGALIFGIAPLLFFLLSGYFYVLLLILLAVVISFFSSHYFKKWLGGYTGDCLGATEQIAEVLFILALIAVWKFS